MKKAASLATLAALSLLGVVLAYWSWAWLAPAVAARAPAAPAAAADSAGGASARLFGSAKQAGAGTASGAVRLMGVVAAPAGRQSHALLRLDAKRTVAVLQGEEVEPGLRLAEVNVDGVVLERGGVRQTLALPEKGSK